MNRVILEHHLELITFTAEGRLLHTHKSTFVQRHSLETWITKAQRRPLRLTLIISGGENRSSRRLNLCWRCAMCCDNAPGARCAGANVGFMSFPVHSHAGGTRRIRWNYSVLFRSSLRPIRACRVNTRHLREVTATRHRIYLRTEVVL